MEQRGETPGGMPLYQRDSRTIPQSSGHEEETDGFDAGGAFSWGAFGWGRELNEKESSLMQIFFF